MTHDGPPPRHLQPVAGNPGEPPFDPAYDTPAPPPHTALDAERAVLGAMLLTPTVIPDVTAHITGADYYQPRHETIHTAILDLHTAGTTPDAITVTTELQRRGDLTAIGGAPYLHALAGDVPIPGNAGHYATTVRDAARLRRAATIITKAKHALDQGTPDQVDVVLGNLIEVVNHETLHFGPSTTNTGLKDLGWLLTTGQAPQIPPPTWCRRTDDTALFYAGKVNGVFGDPEAAKTWLAQIAGIEALNSGGTFAMIDVDHNGQDHTTARLLLLGARPEHIADPDRFRYYEPEDAEQLRAAVDDITNRAPDVLLVDSLGEIFPMLGVNTNDGDEISTAMRLVCTRPANAGSCVITIDHLPKGADARATGYAIGSIAKKRMIRGSYIRAEVRQQPVPGGIGRVTLRIEKDTAGELRKSSGGGYAGTLTLDSTLDHTTTWSIGREEAPKNDDGSFRPTALMEQISRYIETNDQCTFTEIKDAVVGKDKWLRTAIELLLTEGFISRLDGARRAKLHHSIAQYREAEDDHIASNH